MEAPYYRKWPWIPRTFELPSFERRVLNVVRTTGSIRSSTKRVHSMCIGRAFGMIYNRGAFSDVMSVPAKGNPLEVKSDGMIFRMIVI